jgi:hypothetical protein
MKTTLTGFILLIMISTASSQNTNSASIKLIEIRSYNLKPGTRDQFHKLVKEVTLPMLEKVKMKVIAYGPSSHDADSYFLVRLFDDLDDRQKQEDAFYGSDEWRKGPREKVLSFIESYTTITVLADENLIKGLSNL